MWPPARRAGGRTVSGGFLGDKLAQPGSRVSSVDHAPWRRRENSGLVGTPERKYERLFGPDTRNWIESTLCDYASARRQIGTPEQQLRVSMS